MCIDDKQVNRIGTHVEHPESHRSTLLIPGPAGLAGPAKDPEVAPEVHRFPLCPVDDSILSEPPPSVLAKLAASVLAGLPAPVLADLLSSVLSGLPPSALARRPASAQSSRRHRCSPSWAWAKLYWP